MKLHTFAVNIFSMCEFIDIHTHRFHSGILIYNIADHFDVEYRGLYSMGIHPKNTEKMSLDYLKKCASDGLLIAIGEAGIDRNSTTDLDMQISIFKQEIAISEQYKLPMIIHCVRAYPELLHIRQETHAEQPWIIHGFNNNIQILNELLKYGFYISVGHRILNPNSNIRKLLNIIPLNRLFFETDDSDCSIQDIYQEAATLRSTDIQTIKKQIFINFNHIFQI